MGLDSIGFDKTLFVISKVSDQLADVSKAEGRDPFAFWLTDCNAGGWLGEEMLKFKSVQF